MFASSDPSSRPRRSVLYLPASNERALAKAASLPCDAIVLDLEDAVAPDAKPGARDAACEAVASGSLRPREVAIRINGAGTPWHEADLVAACAAGPDAIVAPKVDSPEDVRVLVAAMDAHGAAGRTALWLMIESPAAVLRCADLAAAHDRVSVLVLGTNDLAKELRVEHVPGREPLLGALGHVVLAARATGRGVLDGVFNDVSDGAGFAAECAQGARLGFDGKSVIHPSQVEPANDAFGPSSDAVSEAREILDVWSTRGDAGVVTYRGRLVESLHVDSARRILALRDAIDAREGRPRPS